MRPRMRLPWLADSNTFLFSYTLSGRKVTQADVTDQRSKVRRMTFNSAGYLTSTISAFGTADSQQTT